MTSKIRLLLSDIDGTLVPRDKVLTERTLRAVEGLHDAGITFAVTSSRPPRGLRMYFGPLDLTTPIAAFNGGTIVDTHLNVLQEDLIGDELVAGILDALEENGVAPWVYRGPDWYVRDADGPHVYREAEVCEFEPVTVANFDAVSNGVAKIVGVSDDVAALARARTTIRASMDSNVSATNSQSYYLDVTNCDANKGAVVDYLSTFLGIATAEIATIGDAQNDVSMFERSGLSIAMGNADDDVKASAREVTSSYEDEGFARAVERFILSQ